MGVDLRKIHREPPTFKVVEAGRNRFLECSYFPNGPAHQIGVRFLKFADGAQPLMSVKRKWTCLCFQPRWMTVKVVVGEHEQWLSLKVADFVKKWRVSEKDVRGRGGDDGLLWLAQQACPVVVENGSDTPVPARLSPPPSTDLHPVVSESASKQVTDAPDASQDESKLTMVVHPDEPDDAEVAAGGFDKATLSALKKKTMRGGSKSQLKIATPDESKWASPEIFDQFPLTEVTRYLANVGESERAKLIGLFRREWVDIQNLIATNKGAWEATCERNGAFNLIIRPNPHSSLHLEYFFFEGIVFIHFNCNQTPLALNFTTGVLCRRTVINKDVAERLIPIQRLSHRCRSIQFHAVSAFKSGSGMAPRGLGAKMPAQAVDQKEMFRVMVPFFSMSLTDALQFGILNKANRDRVCLQWLEGLDCLHAADIAHFGISPEALLVDCDPKTGEYFGTIGGFTHAFFISKPPERILITNDFHKAMPPECQASDKSVAVPKNAQGVDIYQMGCCFRDVYGDVFQCGPLLKPKSALIAKTRAEWTRVIIEQMLDPDPALLRISADRAVARWKALPPEEQ